MKDTPIYQVFTESQLSISDFAKRIGLSRQAVYKIFHGDAQPSLSTLQRVSEEFDVSIEYLTGSSPTKYLPQGVKNIYPLDAPIKLPVYGSIAAGSPVATDQSPIDEWIYEDPCYGDGNHFVLKVVGNSMEPGISSGSMAIIKYQNWAERNQIVAVCLYGDYATLKRYVPQRDGSVLFRADNPQSESYVVSKEGIAAGDAFIIGVLKEIKKRY